MDYKLLELRSKPNKRKGTVTGDENIVNIDSKFDVREPLKLKGKTITDFHGEDRILDLEEVFTYSSNIGTAKIAQILGVDRQYNYFKNLGSICLRISGSINFEIRMSSSNSFAVSLTSESEL